MYIYIKNINNNMKISDTKIRWLELIDYVDTWKQVRSGIANLLRWTLMYNIWWKTIFIQNSLVAEELCRPRKYVLKTGYNEILTDDFLKYLFQKINIFMINNGLNEFVYDLDTPKNLEEPIWIKDNEIKQYSKIQEFNNFSITELSKLYMISNNYKTDIVLLTYLKWLWIDIYYLINNKTSEKKINLFKYFANIELQNIQKFVASDSFDKLLLSVFNDNWENEIKQYIITNLANINKMFANNSNKIELWIKVKLFQENPNNKNNALTVKKSWELSIETDKMIAKHISRLWFNELLKNRITLKEQIEKDLDWELIKIVFQKIKEFTKELKSEDNNLYTCIQWWAINRRKWTLQWDTFSAQKEKDLSMLFDIFSDDFDLFKKMVENIKIYSINNYISLYKKHFFDTDKKNFLINIVKNSNSFRCDFGRDERITNTIFEIEKNYSFWIDFLDKKDDINFIKDIDKKYFNWNLHIDLYFWIFFHWTHRVDKINPDIMTYFLFEKMKINNIIPNINSKVFNLILNNNIDNSNIIDQIYSEWVITTKSSEYNHLYFSLFIKDFKEKYIKKVWKYKFNKVLINLKIKLSKKAKERYFWFNNFSIKSEYFELLTDEDNITEEQALELFNLYDIDNIDIKANFYKYTKKWKIILNFWGDEDVIKSFLK